MISLLVGDDATMSEGATSRFVNMLQHLVLLSDDAIAIIGGAAFIIDANCNAVDLGDA